MNRGMQQKIAAFKKMAKPKAATASASTGRMDSLAKVVQSKKDAENLMADIESVVYRARLKKPVSAPQGTKR